VLVQCVLPERRGLFSFPWAVFGVLAFPRAFCGFLRGVSSALNANLSPAGDNFFPFFLCLPFPLGDSCCGFVMDLTFFAPDEALLLSSAPTYDDRVTPVCSIF